MASRPPIPGPSKASAYKAAGKAMLRRPGMLPTGRDDLGVRQADDFRPGRDWKYNKRTFPARDARIPCRAASSIADKSVRETASHFRPYRAILSVFLHNFENARSARRPGRL